MLFKLTLSLLVGSLLSAPVAYALNPFEELNQGIADMGTSLQCEQFDFNAKEHQACIRVYKGCQRAELRPSERRACVIRAVSSAKEPEQPISKQSVGKKPNIKSAISETSQARRMTVQSALPKKVTVSNISILDLIERKQKTFPSAPNYLYETPSVSGEISSTWMEMTTGILGTKVLRDKYEEFYLSAVEYRGLAQLQLIRAKRYAEKGEVETAEHFLTSSDHYLKLFNLSIQGAVEAYHGNIDAASEFARGLYEGSKRAVTFGGNTLGPLGSRVVDFVYLTTDFAVQASDIGFSKAVKATLVDILAEAVITSVPDSSLGGKSLSDVITKKTTKAIGSSQVYEILKAASGSSQFSKAFTTLLAKSTAKELNSLTKDQVAKIILMLAGESNDIIINGDCPGEGCKYGERWLAMRDVDVYFAPPNAVGVSLTSLQKKAVVHKGDWVRTESGIVISTRGQGRVDTSTEFGSGFKNDLTSSHTPVKVGDTISIYFGNEECYKTFSAETLVSVCSIRGDGFIEPKYEWWIKIKMRDGTEAWIKSVDHLFMSEERQNHKLAEKIASTKLSLFDILALVDTQLKVGVNINAGSGQYGTDLIEAAISTNDVDLLRALASKGLDIRNTKQCTAYYATMYALKPGGDLMLNFLLENGVSLECIKQPPLHAFLKVHMAIDIYPIDQAIRVAEVLVRNGALVNQLDSQGETIFDALDHLPENAATNTLSLRKALLKMVGSR